MTESSSGRSKRETSLVVGANGHLGNNLVRHLLGKGGRVVAGIRNAAHAPALRRLGSSVVHADLEDRRSLSRAFEKVDVLYLAAGVFRHWARRPLPEIWDANVEGTRHALEAAAEAGVQRVVYISSLGALDRSRNPIDETTWSADSRNVYYASKAAAEKVAWEIAGQFGLPMVAVLPAAIIGENCWRLTPTMAFFQRILDGQLAADPGFWFNLLDVRDAVEGCWLAATRGRPGERYLLANERPTSVEEVVRIAQRLFPGRAIPSPRPLPVSVLSLAAFFMEVAARIKGTEPELQRSTLATLSIRETCDIGKARRELGFSPRAPYRAVLAALKYLAEGRESDPRLTRRVA